MKHKYLLQAQHKKTRLAILLLVLSFILGACAGLPINGDVHVVKRLEQREGDVVLDPKGPSKGATAEQIVSGFLRASSVGLTDDFTAARQFLTKETAANWNPLTKVRLYPDSETYSSSQTPSGAFRVSVSAYGSLDSDGIYTSLSDDSQITTEFSLIRNADGEWRIAVLDDGILMSRSLFDSLYVQAPLYFPSRTDQSLVADVRWYPRQQVISAIAYGIAKGPAKWLSPAISNVFPTDVTVESAQIRAEDSIVTIDLSAGATALPEKTIALLRAQYQHSYAAAGVAQDVILTTSNSQISSGENIELSSYPLEESPLIAIRDGAVVRVSGNAPRFNALIPADLTANLGLHNLALSYGENLTYGSALDAQGAALYLLDFRAQTLREVFHGSQLIPPSIDAAGWIWSGEQKSNGKLIAVQSSTGKVVSVNAPELAGADIKYLKISREGARVVVVAEREGKQQLTASAIARGDSGLPEQLGGSLQIGQQLVDIHDLAWIDESNLVLIGRYTLASNDSLLQVQIGGPTKNLNTMNDPIGLTAANGTDSIVLVDQSGVLYEYTSGAWRRIAEQISWPAMAG